MNASLFLLPLPNDIKTIFGFAYNFVISVPSERYPSLPGSNTGSFERPPNVSNALKFGFS